MANVTPAITHLISQAPSVQFSWHRGQRIVARETVVVLAVPATILQPDDVIRNVILADDPVEMSIPPKNSQQNLIYFRLRHRQSIALSKPTMAMVIPDHENDKAPRLLAISEPEIREFTQAECDEHNALAREGWSLIDKLILLQGTELKTLDAASRNKLTKAIKCYERALEINPEGWSSMFALGKIYQRLQDDEKSLGWFMKCRALNPSHPDVNNEAGNAALNLGKAQEALMLFKRAMELRPEEPGLLSNMALAYCILGNDPEALRCAEQAVKRNPKDKISEFVFNKIRQVATGQIPRPKTMRITPLI